MNQKYDRIKLLLKDDFTKLEDAKIILLGVGGVGSFCLDCLYRSGVKNITIVDFDSYDESNQNRQMWSELHENETKVEALKEHYPELHVINKRIDEAWVQAFDFEAYDLVLDAIDDRNAKLALAQKCHKKLISSFGSAKRLDPTKVQVGDIWKSYGDKFGSKIRYELKKRGFKKKYKVIFSSEEAVVKEKGSFMGVTATFGLTMCAEAIKKITAGIKVPVPTVLFGTHPLGWAESGGKVAIAGTKVPVPPVLFGTHPLGWAESGKKVAIVGTTKKREKGK